MEGIIVNHQEVARWSRPELIIKPKDTAGGCKPTPRKDKVDSERMIELKLDVLKTMMGEAMFFRTCLTAM